MNLFDKILPEDETKRKWTAIGLTVFLTILFTLLIINYFGKYGIALFILLPVFIGANSTILYGYKTSISSKDARNIGFLTLTICVVVLLAFAIEGLVCIVMASPLIILLTWVGSLIGSFILERVPNSTPFALLILVGSIPITASMEKVNDFTLTSIVTSIEINAPPQKVWRNVIEFPELDKPTEFIFKVGIAYPINAKITGIGVRSVRSCNFTTGSFIEPITVWNEPELLKFNVDEQPAPMKELSFWDIDAPHLHDYFVSKQGQFKLTQLPNGNTLLEGTTWYYNNIHPNFYWNIWSDYIVHRIHERVLTHIKKISEAS
ncbi:MAG: hypothetical protein HYZ54_07835 [Ignavibacteriae bacterium]|nr:hypothetical protein [Ignavibacteriota bacterium]